MVVEQMEVEEDVEGSSLEVEWRLDRGHLYTDWSDNSSSCPSLYSVKPVWTLEQYTYKAALIFLPAYQKSKTFEFLQISKNEQMFGSYVIICLAFYACLYVTTQRAAGHYHYAKTSPIVRRCQSCAKHYSVVPTEKYHNK